MTPRALTEIDAAAFLGCRTIKEAVKVLRAIPPAARLPDGPRWTETQLLVVLGEKPSPRKADPALDEAKALAAVAGI